MVNNTNILICAYACEPNKGSEPEVGWQWVVSMAEHFEVTVVTRSNNEPSIVNNIPKTKYPINFEYVEASSLALFLKKTLKRFHITKGLYNSMWQKAASSHIRKLSRNRKYSIIQHITLASYRYPFAVTGHNSKSIIGPIGGIEIFPYQLLPKNQPFILAKEGFRNVLTQSKILNYFTFRRIKKADLVICSTKQMYDECRALGINAISYPTIGVKSISNDKPTNYSSKKNNFLFVGNITYLKGLEILLHAMKKLPSDIKLSIIGSASEESNSLFQLIEKLELQDRVTYLGRMPRNELLEAYKNFDALLFPSMHDSGGFVILEAALSGLPSIAYNHGGPSVLIQANKTGLLSEIGSKEDSIINLADAILEYNKNPDLCSEHGMNAFNYVTSNFLWEQKALFMKQVYDDLLNERL